MNALLRWLAAGILLVGCTLQASATLILVPEGQDPSDDLIFNFDFTGVTPSPPYPFIAVDYPYTGLDAGEEIWADVFDELNGGGSRSFFVSGAVGFGLPSTTNPGVTDGMFSVGFHITGGTALLVDAPTAYAASAGVRVTPLVVGQLAGAQLLEPGVLVLLLTVLCALGVTNRWAKFPGGGVSCSRVLTEWNRSSTAVTT